MITYILYMRQYELYIGACGHDHLLPVHVRGLRGDRGDLRHLLALLLQVGDLLTSKRP